MPETIIIYEPRELRARRESLGLTREQIAVRIERSAQTISLWELGRTAIPFAMRGPLLDALGLDERVTP